MTHKQTNNERNRTQRIGTGILGMALLVGLSACATPPPADDPVAVADFKATNDPFEPLNRDVFEFNLGVDRYFLKPAAEGYRTIVPEHGRTALRNVVNNVQEPVTFINDVLQGEIGRAGTTLGRFLVNSTIGIGGIFNVAAQQNLTYHSEDFDQTLAVHGVPEGPYLVLPLLNSSSVRHGVGRIVDAYSNPIFYAFDNAGEEWVQPTVTAVDVIDARSRNIETLNEIERTAIDFYTTARSAYRQSRDTEINNGIATESSGTDVDPFDVDY